MKIIILIFILNTICHTQDLNFFRESIDIEINNNFCILKGRYYFKNISNEPIVKKIFYPFIVDKNSAYPDSISVFNVNETQKIEYKRIDSGIHFILQVQAKSVVIVNICFSQKVRIKKYEYILLTTQKWNHCLDLAEFSIKIPCSYKIQFLSYPFKKLNENENICHLYMQKKHFMPEKNLIIKWDG